ncbi:GMC oxidoreductase [Zasmidium cellare ATCC 36951]|uniref:GMC oxidoreductase n=1 Tax=Zasmidium cellare ATCC 36951 TaxID=1080233 RepID=A0A6A6CMS3_ZASCE|nr:GMC oxidoreductase [Zasmidium cellare ATCC 36951]KAF2168557.1 GMC oxidoreductase [Zasmidium cellare ATCC 36951]
MKHHFLLLPLLTLGCDSSIISQLSGEGRLTGSSFGIPGRNATYDYVIVGGGLAGSVVASRITEHTNASVAIIEAGSFYELSNGNWSQIPYWSEQWVGAGEEDWQPLIDWGLMTEPQVSGKRIHYAQGKTLGGSSARNQMLWHRGTKGAYRKWADQVGDDSYTWENMLKYFQRSVNFTPDVRNRTVNGSVYDAAAYTMSGGPLHVSYQKYIYPLSQYAPAAFASVGMKSLPGFASGDLDGYGWWQSTIDPETGLRSSAEATFLEAAFKRPTLTTYINSQARNIIFQNGSATGVNVTNYGQRPFTLSARKEVIVSAGAYHSPQLLMVSGIGPRSTLQRFDIPVIKDLPGVGQNMWDSQNLGGPTYEISVPGFSTWQQPGYMEEVIDQLRSNGSGPLTNIGLDVGAWNTLPDRSKFSAAANKSLAAFPADWPLIEHSIQSSSKVLGTTDSKTQYGVIACLVIAPTSRGNMTIQSASNLDRPIIDPNWLRDPTDQEVAIQGYRAARRAWQAIPEGIRVGDEVSPGKNVTSDADLLEAIKKNLSPIHHASSSCAMGRKNDTMAVVDSKAKVFGVRKLRVIDSSSFPFTPPGHTQGITYGHAEKLVDDVLDDYFASQ